MAVKKYDRLESERSGSLRERAWGGGLLLPRRPGIWAALAVAGVFWFCSHRTFFGFFGTALGRGALLAAALFVSGASIVGDTWGAHLGAWTLWLILAACLYGAYEYRRRSTLEESIIGTIREAVPGHNASFPPEVTFGPRLRWPEIYRWTGRYDFCFRVPNVVRRSDLFDLEEHLAERLRANDDSTWFVKWNLKLGSAKATCIPEIPRLITYAGLGHALGTYPGGERVAADVIPLAISTRGVEFWEPGEVPHCLFGGTTGSGKSVALQTVLAHVLRHPERWDIFGVDPKRVELSDLRGYPNVRKVATDVEDMAEVIEAAWSEMERRYEEMEKAGRGHKKYLKHNPNGKRILVVVDELADITAVSGAKTEEAKAEDALAGLITYRLEKLAAKGRASAVHLLLCTQRPDVADSVMSGKMRANVPGRLACGHMDASSSKMILKDSTAAAELDPEGNEKGRAIWLPDARPRKVQIVLTEAGDLPPKEEVAA